MNWAINLILRALCEMGRASGLFRLVRRLWSRNGCDTMSLYLGVSLSRTLSLCLGALILHFDFYFCTSFRVLFAFQFAWALVLLIFQFLVSFVSVPCGGGGG